jgi:hypothetical protein
VYSLYCFFSTQSGGVKVSKGKLQEHGRLAVAKASLNERKELAWQLPQGVGTAGISWHPRRHALLKQPGDHAR